MCFLYSVLKKIIHTGIKFLAMPFGKQPKDFDDISTCGDQARLVIVEETAADCMLDARRWMSLAADGKHD